MLSLLQTLDQVRLGHVRPVVRLVLNLGLRGDGLIPPTRLRFAVPAGRRTREFADRGRDRSTGRRARKHSAGDTTGDSTAVGDNPPLGHWIRPLTQAAKSGKLLVPTEHAHFTDKLAAGSERLRGGRLFEHLHDDIVAGLQRADLIHVGLVIKIDSAVIHGTAARTTFIMRAAAALQMQFLSWEVDAQYPAVHGLRLRQPLKEVRTIKRIHAGARSGHVPDAFAHAQTGLVALQPLLGDRYTHGADKKNCRS